jgi:PAS domain S-box-containing protein
MNRAKSRMGLNRTRGLFIHKTMNASVTDSWDERTSASESPLKHIDGVFESFFERSADAVWLFDPQTGVFVDCNEAAVKLIGAKTKQELLQMRPDELSPPTQPDGSGSADRSPELIAAVEKEKSIRFEWMMRRMDGRDVPIEVTATAVLMEGRRINVIISRDISERKKAERELLELNQSLERRVAERTAALSTSEARFRALVEHAPEAIVVFDGDTGRFRFGNEHACRLYGVPMEKLAELTPADVSPEFQPDGRRSSELARELMMEALAGGTPVFEWMHRQPDGRLIPTEVRLLPLPAEGQNLIRASILDNTERKSAERALRESEAKYRALFEGSSHGVVLHDENEILEVNPAAVWILGREKPKEVIGRHPRQLAPQFQPSGETSEALGTKHVEECMARGSARFEWLASAPDGREIPLEVALTRIEWSGRQVIQAFITDITARQNAQTALAESEARFSAAFQASPIFITISQLSDGRFVLVNDSFVNWTGYRREEIVGRDTNELSLWNSTEDRASFWGDLRLSGFVRDRECGFHNREGEQFTILLSSEVIQINGVPHILSMGLDITGRKQAEAELRASEARLRESEARFSVAFQASPVFIAIINASDGKFVLVNDALVNWLGCSRELALGQRCADLGMWETLADRAAVWEEVSSAGRVRQKECRWRNLRGEFITILLSAETITVANAPHVLLLALDISRRKQAEVEILKSLAREKELSELKSNFVSMVSHEFRTPLGIIQSSAELLRDFHQKMVPAECAEQLESITRNTGRMAGMMEEVLVLSRLDAGKLDFKPVALDLNLFCHRIVDEILSATNRRCVIELSLASVPVDAQADEQLLGHIFTNLLSNAVKYSEPGATVRFAIERDGVDAVCMVGDRGIGISEDDQQELFKAFHRGSNVGTRPGTGLGLLLVKRCAQMHGGRVQVKSTIGEGTNVTVRLPIFSQES